MAYPDPHWLLTIGGELPGAEQWTTTLRLAGVHVTTALLGQAACQAYADAIEAQWTNLTAWTHFATLTDIKLNWVDTAGHYLDSFTNLVHYETPVLNGGTDNIPKPNQLAWVISLGTAASRGHAHAGRMFMPCPSYALSNDGLISAENAATGTVHAVALLDAINAVDVVSAHIHVMSKIGAGESRPVTKAAVGRAVDTMRSRRRSLVESRVFDDLAV